MDPAVSFPVCLQAQEKRIEKLGDGVSLCHVLVFEESYLVIVRCTHKDDRTISRDIEGTSGTYFSEENLGDDSPEHQRSFICYGHLGDVTSCRTKRTNIKEGPETTGRQCSRGQRFRT